MACPQSAQLAHHLRRQRRPACHDRPLALVLNTGVRRRGRDRYGVSPHLAPSAGRALPRHRSIDATRMGVWQPVRHMDAETRVPGLGTERANGVAMHAADHFVRFYETDAFLLDAVATFCADAILMDGAAVVVATAEHRAGIAERLRRVVSSTTGTITTPISPSMPPRPFRNSWSMAR